MMSSFRSWPLVALLAMGGAFSQSVAAPARPAVLMAADPYNTYYPQGVSSAESYLGIQPDGSAPDPLYRSLEEAYAEKQKAEGMRDQSTTLNDYYYLSGYIDRLSYYVETGGH